MAPFCSSTFAPLSAVLALILATTPIRGQSGAALRIPICLIEVDQHHKGTLLAGTATARLYRSRDGGDTWAPLPFPPALRSDLHAILIDPDTPDVYWVAVSSENPELAGVYRSVDEGVTWQLIPGLARKQVWAFVPWNVDAHIIAAGTEDGVYLSRDGGRNWTPLSLHGAVWPRPVMSLAFDPTDSNTLYAGTPHLAWKTSDGGKTWRQMHRGMQEDSDIFTLDVDGRRRSRLFAGACSGIYRSSDGGSTWLNLERVVGGQFRTYVVRQAPGHPEVIYAGTSAGLVVSHDSGASWNRLSTEAVRSVAFDADDPRHIFIATNSGVLRIEDSGMPVHLTGVGGDEHRPCGFAATTCSPRF